MISQTHDRLPLGGTSQQRNAASKSPVNPLSASAQVLSSGVSMNQNVSRPVDPNGMEEPPAQKSSRKWIWLGLALILLAGVGAMFMRDEGSDGPKSLKDSLQVESLTRGALVDKVSSTGTLAAQSTVEVSTQVSGIVSKVMVDFNSKVTRGQVLATLDKSIYEAQLRSKEASMAKVNADLALARAEYDRNKPLFEKGYLSAEEMLTIETTLQQAKATKIQAEEDLKQAQTNLGYTTIHSPIDGTVIERSVDEGQTVAANFSAPTLFIIAGDLSRMQIEASVDESDIARIHEGQTVHFTVQSYTDKSFEGKVRQVRLNPTTVSNVVTYKVIVDADNSAGLLLPGMTATVDFIVSEVGDALLVSNSAFLYKPSKETGVQPREKQVTGTRREKALSQGGTSAAETAQKKALYYLDGTGALQKTEVVSLLTDGIHTAVPLDGPLQEGSQVVTGAKETEKTQKSGGLSSFLRPPRGSGPPGGR